MMKASATTGKRSEIDAIRCTIQAIERRSRSYRNLIVAVSIVGLGSVGLAVAFRDLVTLAGLIVLVPLVGGFFFLDSRLVQRWRAEILDMCRAGEVNLTAFRKTILQLRNLPAGSLQGMLSMLPPDAQADQDQGRLLEERFASRLKMHEPSLLLATLLLTIALVCLSGAIYFRSLAYLISAVVCFLLSATLRCRQMK
jgi:hypothetical protein